MLFPWSMCAMIQKFLMFFIRLCLIRRAKIQNRFVIFAIFAGFVAAAARAPLHEILFIPLPPSGCSPCPPFPASAWGVAGAFPAETDMTRGCHLPASYGIFRRRFEGDSEVIRMWSAGRSPFPPRIFPGGRRGGKGSGAAFGFLCAARRMVFAEIILLSR